MGLSGGFSENCISGVGRGFGVPEPLTRVHCSKALALTAWATTCNETIQRKKIMPNENAPPAPETPAVPTTPPVVEIPEAPPATKLVVHGVKSEREIELEGKLAAAEQRQRDAEFLAAEKEREAQELKKIPTTPRAEKKPAKKHNWLAPIIGADDED